MKIVFRFSTLEERKVGFQPTTLHVVSFNSKEQLTSAQQQTKKNNQTATHNVRHSCVKLRGELRDWLMMHRCVSPRRRVLFASSSLRELFGWPRASLKPTTKRQNAVVCATA